MAAAHTISERLGIYAAVLNASPKDVARLARTAGFRGLLFDVWSKQLNFPELSVSGMREVRHLASSQDQKLIAMRMDLGERGLTIGADIDQQIDRVEKGLRAAADSGAGTLCIDLGPLPRAPVRPQSKKAIAAADAGSIIIPSMNAPEVVPIPAAPVDVPFTAQVNGALVEIGKRADRYGAMVALSSTLAGFASLSAVLAEARCPWFGVDLDPVALSRDDWSADDIFSTVGPIIRHVQGRDALIGDDQRTRGTVVGCGNVRWPELISLLDQAGFHGYLTLNSTDLNDRIGGAVDGAKYLRTLAD